MRLAEEISRLPTEVDLSLVSGDAGRLLLFDYAAQCGADVPSSLIDSRFGNAFEAAAEQHLDLSLYYGYTGLAWAAVRANVSAAISGDALTDLDSTIEQAVVDASASEHTYDLFRGLSGIAVYAADRAPHPFARRLSQTLCLRLSQQAVRTELQEVTWLTHRSQAASPNGAETYHDFGFPRGLLGPMAALAGIAHLANREIASQLAADSVRWLLSQRKPGVANWFPSAVSAGRRYDGLRLSWCHGDLPAAITLVCLGNAFDHPEWTAAGTEIGLHCARAEPAGVVDASLCHGALGIGHAFAHLYNTCGNDVLKTASIRWTVAAMEMRRHGVGIGGYEVLVGREWSAKPGFIRGVSGIALALLSAACPVVPRWSAAIFGPAVWSPGSLPGECHGA